MMQVPFVCWSWRVLSLLAVAGVAPAPECDTGSCKSPECRCPKDEFIVPHHVHVPDVPRMICIVFYGPVDASFWSEFRKLFPTKDVLKNPNGCPMKATLMVTNRNTNYCNVQKAWNEAHELGSGGLGDKPANWWTVAGKDDQEQEIADQIDGQAKLIEKNAEVPGRDIVGFQYAATTELSYVTKATYSVLDELQWRYVLQRPTQLNSGWPFTLDFVDANRMKCDNPDFCTFNEKETFDGLWVVPMTKTPKMACKDCTNHSTKVAEEILQKLEEKTNVSRAPLVIGVKTVWASPESAYHAVFEGLATVLKNASRRSDVWVTTVSHMLDWVADPMKNSRLTNDQFAPWKCRSIRYQVRCGDGDDADPAVENNDGEHGETDEEKKDKTAFVVDGDLMVIWTYVVLGVLLVIIIRVDKTSGK